MSDVTTPTTSAEDTKVTQSTLSKDGIAELIRKNLFKDAKNSVLTIVVLGVLFLAVRKAIGFVFFNTKINLEGEAVDAWRVVSVQLIRYMVGSDLRSDTEVAGFLGGGAIELWMIWAAVYLLVATLGFAVGRPKGVPSPPMRWRTVLGIIFPPLLAATVLLSMTDTWPPRILTMLLPAAFFLGRAVPALLPEAVLRRKGIIMVLATLLVFLLETGFRPGNVDAFGGLLLTVNTAFLAIVLCFPIGVVAALVRRSSFPLLRPIAVLYIELIRGVPLITLLFMGQFALGRFLPPDATQPPDVIKAIVMMTLFSGAYVAEIVRGGLQSVAAGQTEAGQAVGLQPLTITRKIVLPQALRNSIPALVGQFIALLKDTTLLVIIGLQDILGESKAIVGDPEFVNQGYASEVYAFVAFMFWVICFSMSRASQRLETNLGVGNNR